MVQSEGLYQSDWLKYEQPVKFSREDIVVLAGSGSDRVLTNGMVLGKITKGAATPAAVAGNTGNGTVGAVTIAAGAKVGVYKLWCIEPATNAGRFTLEDPDGVQVGNPTVGVAFSGVLGFTIADGATDFVAGDAFTITVAAGSGKFVQINFAATDGSEVAAGLLWLDVTAPNGVDAKGVAIVRDAIVSDRGIVWPGGASGGQKTQATAELKALGILTREGA